MIFFLIETSTVKKSGDVLNRYRTLAYGDLPQSATSDSSDERRYENKDKDENTLTADSNGDNTAPSVTFETRDGVGRIRLLNGSLSTDKTDNVN